MSTIQEFEDAPVGATATHRTGERVIKSLALGMGQSPWASEYMTWWKPRELEAEGFTLDDPPTPDPSTAREALALAWDLAHPIKEGQFIPEGVRYVRRSQDGGLVTLTAAGDWTPDPRLRDGVRTLDPPPETEPDWLDAPAVMARVKGWVSCADPLVFTRGNKTGTQPFHEGYWRSSITGLLHHWNDLEEVTPLYPEGEKE